MDETMPAAVCCSATSERTTPIKGPVTEPAAICHIAFLSLKESFISCHLLLQVIIIV
jgi:hypothetical protein